MSDNLLSFHALTLLQPSVVIHENKSCWKTFQKHPLLVSGVGLDGELARVEKFVCHLYGTPEEPTTNHARLQLFVKATKGLEMLPWNFMQYVSTTRHISGCKQTKIT